jgi:hypothetical protein
MPYIGYITGQPYETIEAMKAGEKEYVQRQQAQLEPDYLYDENAPTPEEVLAAAKYVEQAGQDRAKQVSDERAAEVFCQLHAEYIPTPRNAMLLEYALKAKGILDDRYVTVEEIESAYDELRQRGLIEVNNQAAQAQHKTEVRDQAEEIRSARKSRPSSGISTRTISRSTRPSFSEDDLYGMSLDDLRSLAMREAGVE